MLKKWRDEKYVVEGEVCEESDMKFVECLKVKTTDGVDITHLLNEEALSDFECTLIDLGEENEINN